MVCKKFKKLHLSLYNLRQFCQIIIFGSGDGWGVVPKGGGSGSSSGGGDGS